MAVFFGPSLGTTLGTFSLPNYPCEVIGLSAVTPSITLIKARSKWHLAALSTLNLTLHSMKVLL